VRLALGAEERQITAMILSASMPSVLVGASVGLVLSFALTPLLSSVLVGVRPIEPALLVCVLLFIALVGLFASSMPVERVLRQNPLSSLHYD